MTEQEIQTAAEERAQMIADARRMIDWIEQHPELRFPGLYVYRHVYRKEELLDAARAMRTFEKFDDKFSPSNGRIEKHFGQSKFSIEYPKSLTCRKVKVVKEVEEWECDPLLSSEEEAALGGSNDGTN